MREDQLVPGPRHRHVAQASLLSERQLRRGRQPPTETGRQGQGVAPADGREAPRDHTRQEHDRELEPLRLVDGEDGHGVRVGIELGGRRVVAGVDERLEMGRDEDRAVVDQEGRLAADDLEEPGDVGERFLGADGVGRREAGQQAARAQEAVQQLTRRPFVGDLAIPTQVGDELGDRRACLRPDTQDARLPVQLLEDLADRPIAASGHVHDRGQVVAAEPVHLRGRERVQIHAGVRFRDHAQEGEQQAHLRPGVQTGRSREAPRDASDIEGAQERIGVPVRADQDRVVAR